MNTKNVSQVNVEHSTYNITQNTTMYILEMRNQVVNTLV
jgi:hypothetical protein